MAREILVEGLDDDDYVVVEVDEKEEWWQRLKKLQGEYGAELAARDLEAKKHILGYDPKQGAATISLGKIPDTHYPYPKYPNPYPNYPNPRYLILNSDSNSDYPK
jgi:hypothetical protein